MKAVVFYGQGDIRVENVADPNVRPGFVKVTPKYCGICGTDLHEFIGGPNITPTLPHPLTGEQVPLIFGHEFSAMVEEVGEGVLRCKVGDRVTVEPILWDGECSACIDGVENCCVKGGFIGLSGWGGGLSEHCVVPETSLYKLPADVSMEVGALVEPLAVGWHAVKVSPFKTGDIVLVLGGGPIGLSVIQSLRAKGAEKIIVSEVAQRRKEFALEFGATDIVDPLRDDLVNRCRELTAGRGVDLVFDCAGIQTAFDQAIDSLRVRGTLVNISIWEKEATINPTKILLKEKKYMGIVTYARGDFQEVLDAISGGLINPERMITKKIALDEILQEGFETLINDKANHVKILVECT